MSVAKEIYNKLYLFQWKSRRTGWEGPKTITEIRQEAADVSFLLCIMFQEKWERPFQCA